MDVQAKCSWHNLRADRRNLGVMFILDVSHVVLEPLYDCHRQHYLVFLDVVDAASMPPASFSATMIYRRGYFSGQTSGHKLESCLLYSTLVSLALAFSDSVHEDYTEFPSS